MTTEELIQTFIKVREKKSQLKAEYEARIAKYEEVQNKIEALLLIKFDEDGTTSAKTPAGTAYTSTLASVSVADKDVFKEFCSQQDDPFLFIDLRANKTAIEQYKAANEDLPPGLNWSETRTIRFRKS